MIDEVPCAREFVVSAYSACAYFAELLLSNYEKSFGLQKWTLKIPVKGLVHIEGGPQSQKTLGWIDALCFQSKLDEKFATEVKKGAIPRIGQVQKRLSAPIKVTSVSPLKFVGSERTLLSLVEAREEIISTLLDARIRYCRICGQPVSLFKTSSEIERFLSINWRDQIAELTVCGGEAIVDWGREHGLRVGSERLEPTGMATVLLDSVKITEFTLATMHHILESAWSIPATVLRLKSTERRCGYSRNGYCNTCDRDGVGLSRTNLDSLLRRPLHGELTIEIQDQLDRAIGTLPFSMVLQAPLGELPISTFPAGMKFTNVIEDLVSLDNDFPPLASQCKELSTAQISAATVVARLRNEDIDTTVVIDSPYCNSTEDAAERLTLFLQNSSKSRTIVVLGNKPSGGKGLATDETPAEDSKLLFRITRHSPQEETLRIPIGGIVAVRSSRFPLEILLRNYITGSLQDRRFSIEEMVEPFPEVRIVDYDAMSSNSLLIEDLDWYERLSKTFAASLQARALGIQPLHFKRTSAQNSSRVCPTCKGLAFHFATDLENGGSSFQPCLTCHGKRFTSPLSDVQFRGRTIWEVLSTPIRDAKYFVKSVPNARVILDAIERLGLDVLPLGIPTRLLSTTERFFLSLVKSAFHRKHSAPLIIFVAHPTVGLSENQKVRFVDFVKSSRSSTLSWIFETNDEQLLETCTDIALWRAPKANVDV